MKSSFKIFLKTAHAKGNLRIYLSLENKQQQHRNKTLTQTLNIHSTSRRAEELTALANRKVHWFPAQNQFPQGKNHYGCILPCLEIQGSQPLKFEGGLLKSLAVWGLGDPEIQVEAHKERVTQNSQSRETLLLKIMTEIYDCFLPRQKGAQLEGWKQQALCASTLCFADPTAHWLGGRNKQDNTLSTPKRREQRGSQLRSFLGMYVHTVYSQIEVLKKTGRATVRD